MIAHNLGVISDTHGLVRPEALAVLQDCDYIVHAGDIGKPKVLEALAAIAPLHTIRGNIDRDEWAAPIPETKTFTYRDRRFFVLHDVKALSINPTEQGIDCVISGHSHKPLIDWRDDVLYLNPGSAGPRRFKLPIALATLTVTSRGLEPTIHEIVPT